MERAKTGIYGLDELLEGGFPVGRTMLVSGGCGAGKTIFAMQYAYRGAMEFKEPSVYVTLDERPNMIRQDMLRFGWDIAKAEKQDKMAIVDASAARIGMPSEEKYALPQVGVDVDRLLLRVMQVVDKLGAKRVVIDGTSGLGMHMESESEVRKAILKANFMLSKTGVTTMMTSEVPEQSIGIGSQYSKYGVEEYIADGVIMLHYLGMGATSNRSLFVRKMRGTKHVEDVLSMDITNKGIGVVAPEDAFKV